MVTISSDGSISCGYGGSNRGKGGCFVFVKPAGGWANTGTFNAELTTANGATGSFNSVAVHSNTVLAGTTGLNAVCGYIRPTTGWANTPPMTQSFKLTASGSTGFGISVAVSGTTLVVGSGYVNPSGTTGAVYIFQSSQ